MRQCVATTRCHGGDAPPRRPPRPHGGRGGSFATVGVRAWKNTANPRHCFIGRNAHRHYGDHPPALGVGRLSRSSTSTVEGTPRPLRARVQSRDRSSRDEVYLMYHGTQCGTQPRCVPTSVHCCGGVALPAALLPLRVGRYRGGPLAFARCASSRFFLRYGHGRYVRSRCAVQHGMARGLCAVSDLAWRGGEPSEDAFGCSPVAVGHRCPFRLVCAGEVGVTVCSAPSSFRE